ncbi:thioredoxin [Pelagibius sp. Alg239-R121]|uniref:thioredoxin n=1 Tax=Pelagibius sp. Alg239-R121 TaxID=2993448 RepID=UPI0024A74A8C|nr:thioredoxin [Pelagibius sp. Alg239-R121]
METIIGAGGPEGSAAAADAVKDGTQETFAKDVIEASMKTPVIVDFWAPWCGPCKQLGPVLEKAVRDTRGAVRMVKVNVDENQAIAQQLRVQSIPAVYAFFQGQPIDGFVGAQQESQIKSFVERLAQEAGGDQGDSPIEQALAQAEAALEDGQHGPASAIFGQILQHEPDNARALSGSIRCRLGADDVEGARELLDALTPELAASPEIASAAAAVELAEQSMEVGEITELARKVEQDENDHQSRYDLALALQGAGKSEDAADALLEIVRRNRAWNDEAARKQLVKFFDAWGQTDPLTQDVRGRLSSILFS